MSDERMFFIFKKLAIGLFKILVISVINILFSLVLAPRALFAFLLVTFAFVALRIALGRGRAYLKQKTV